ncbi:hypothetical protein KM043_012966 [Ampulex compressa]|nr:hypothetical protein KM043_012966 [Ampulex compressa]
MKNQELNVWLPDEFVISFSRKTIRIIQHSHGNFQTSPNKWKKSHKSYALRFHHNSYFLLLCLSRPSAW